jgi:hypothetical protein
MFFLEGIETFSLYFIGVYGANQVWNLFAKNRTQKQIIIDTIGWTLIFILWDKIDAFIGI